MRSWGGGRVVVVGTEKQQRKVTMVVVGGGMRGLPRQSNLDSVSFSFLYILRRLSRPCQSKQWLKLEPYYVLVKPSYLCAVQPSAKF